MYTHSTLISYSKFLKKSLRISGNEDDRMDDLSDQSLKPVSKYTYTSIFNEIFPQFLEKVRTSPPKFDEPTAIGSKNNELSTKIAESASRPNSANEFASKSNAENAKLPTKKVIRSDRGDMSSSKKRMTSQVLNSQDTTGAVPAQISVPVIQPQIKPVELIYFF